CVAPHVLHDASPFTLITAFSPSSLITVPVSGIAVCMPKIITDHLAPAMMYIIKAAWIDCGQAAMFVKDNGVEKSDGGNRGKNGEVMSTVKI
ncbi:MAG: hypothetical protein H6Q96_1165, partial [Nitrospirae bacterium]|nr:hypothetical protein [Nitrospirota bacterium]